MTQLIRNTSFNPILATDSYKLGHWQQYPEGTTGVYSYLEARKGAEYDETVFFGLQPILEQLAGNVVTWEHLYDAMHLARGHFGGQSIFNFKGWERIVGRHHGRLPIRIKAVPEGTVLPVGNVLMTVENTDPEAFWLTNALESMLLHVWYPITVASRSRFVKQHMASALERSGASLDGLPFMLHDFGYRGAATHDTAALGGLAHLVNFMGTDTVPALQLAQEHYDATGAVGYSIPATEHSVMTAMGREGEMGQVQRVLDAYPTGIVSIVADSYDYYGFVKAIGNNGFKEQILARDGKVVVRPDSTTLEHNTPGGLMVWTLESLWNSYGGTYNAKGFRVLDPHIGVIWGDGIDAMGIVSIISECMLHGFSAENLVFGMGGGLLQKVNRDTLRFAFKSSAQQRDGVWHDVQKTPLDATKASKAGRLGLVKGMGGWATCREEQLNATYQPDQLQIVFENGRLVNRTTFDRVRERAAL